MICLIVLVNEIEHSDKKKELDQALPSLSTNSSFKVNWPPPFEHHHSPMEWRSQAKKRIDGGGIHGRGPNITALELVRGWQRGGAGPTAGSTYPHPKPENKSRTHPEPCFRERSPPPPNPLGPKPKNFTTNLGTSQAQ